MKPQSIYRASGRSEERAPEVRELAFFHVRFTVAAFIALAFVAAAVALSTTPRTVTLRCTPEPTPEIRCDARVRSLWGEEDASKTVVTASGGARVVYLIEGEPSGRSSLTELDLDVAYRVRAGDSWSRVVARFAHDQPIPLTDFYPTRFGGPMLRDMFRAEESLRGGREATLGYTTGWGGMLFSLPLCLLAGLILWASSGNTRVRFTPATGRVEVTSWARWWAPRSRRVLGIDEVKRALVARVPGARGGPLYRPALRLASGELIVLGEAGLRKPVRAEHFAGELQRLLGLEKRPRRRSRRVE